MYDATEQAYKSGYTDGREDALGLRPCLADGKPALFHRWADEDKALLKTDALMRPEDRVRYTQRYLADGVVDGLFSAEVIRVTFALVEYPDGSVGRVKPELIQFLDRGEG
jgi:hypothetical protein